MKDLRLGLAASTALAATLIPSLAYAQVAPSAEEQTAASAPVAEQQADATTPDEKPADETSADPTTPEDPTTVVVTADRRVQNLQDYAGTAAVFSGDDLKKRGIQSISDMNDVLPGLTVANNGINREVWIRGIGSSNNTELGDPAAATHWDGVYLPRPSGIGSAFFDIQRVEVNIGPQGTLRGRNATAGSVNVITWKPGLGVWDAEIEGEYGNYDQKVLRGMINVPVGDKAALRFSGMTLSHDSYYKNVGPNSDIGAAEAEDNVAGRAQLLWEPTSRLRVLIAGDYMHETGSGWTGTNYANPLGEGIDPDDIKDPRKVIARAFTPDLDIKHRGVRAEIRYDAGFAKLDYIGSYRRVTSDYKAATPLSPFYPGVIANLSRRLDETTTADPNDLVDPNIVLNEALDNWSRFQSYNDSKSHFHEIRLHNDKGPLIWSVGANFFKEDQYSFLGATGDRSPFFSGIEFNMPDVDAKSYGVYGDATYSVTPKARVTAGLRYTDDRKSREGVAARYAFALGGGPDPFGCCLGVRVGTEGFQFAIKDRTIFNPDTNGDGTISNVETLAFYFNGVKQFGNRDNVDDIFANGPFGYDPVNNPDCLDTITGDRLVCDTAFSDGKFLYGDPFPGQIFRQSGKMRQKFVDWRLRGEYDITKDHLVYGLVTTGHKSGGFNDNLGDLGVAPTYKPEKVTLYELGSKNVFYLGGVRTKLNATVFYNDYKDQVLTSLLSVAQAVDLSGIPGAEIPTGTNQNLVVSFSYNAADSHISGFNVEGGFDLPANFNFDYNLLYLDAKVDEADPIQDFRYQSDVDADGASFRSIDGKRLPRTPKWQLNASLSQTIEVATGKLDYVLSAGYRSSQFQTIFNSEDYTPETPEPRLDDKVGGYWTFDVGAGYSHGTDGKIRIEGYINNLTDAVHESAIIITQFDNTRFFTRPRTYGGRIRLKF